MEYIKKELLPIETKRLVLRLLSPDEADIMVSYLLENREHLRKWEPTRSEKYFTLNHWKTELQNRENEFYLGGAANLVVFPRGSVKGPVIGVCNFTNFMYGVFRACFLGYSIHKDYEGKGIMFEALTAAMEFVFVTFNMHRIMANYMPRNERSGFLLKRLGFAVEGYARDYLEINGKWEDHILTSKIFDH
jgi:ribosomal-protein-alanine N-acetyltransferase